MSQWEWIHVTIGAVAAIIFLLQTLGTAGDDVDADADFDLTSDTDGPGDAAQGLAGYLSVRNFVAFFIGYGWVTLAALLSGVSRLWSSALGVAAGLVFVWVSLVLIKTFLRFQEDGSLKMETLVGKRASVYIAIGPSGTSQGKVLVDTKTGRTELPARTNDREKLSPGALVEIVALDGDVLWVTGRALGTPSE